MPRKIEPSRSDYFQLVTTHANRHRESLYLPKITDVLQALAIISDEKARAYLSGVLASHRPWVNAKGLLEELVVGLSQEEPRIAQGLFNPQSKRELPWQIEEALVELRKRASAVYENLNRPFAQTPEFAELKDGARALLNGYRPALMQTHIQTYQAAAELKPEADTRGAINVIMAEGRHILDEAVIHRKLTFAAAMPVRAMLYLLADVAKTPEEKTGISNALLQYGQTLGNIAQLRPTMGQNVLLERVSAAVSDAPTVRT